MTITDYSNRRTPTYGKDISVPLIPPQGDDFAAPGLPGEAGTRSVQVDPAAIPNLVNALQSSLDSVGLQIEHAITELRIMPWAGDPVSSQAADEFNHRSGDSPEGALAALCGYRDELQSAAESLNEANQQYRQIEDDNISRMGGGC